MPARASVPGECKSGASAVAPLQLRRELLNCARICARSPNGLPQDHLFAIYTGALARFKSAFPVWNDLLAKSFLSAENKAAYAGRSQRKEGKVRS